jgi:hypothetical protein
VRVLRGGCVPLGEQGLPFAPVIEALHELADQLDPAELATVAGPARLELGRLLPDLAWGSEAAAGSCGAGASQAGQGRLFERLLVQEEQEQALRRRNRGDLEAYRLAGGLEPDPGLVGQPGDPLRSQHRRELTNQPLPRWRSISRGEGHLPRCRI